MNIGIHNLYDKYNKMNAIFDFTQYECGAYLWYGNVCLKNLMNANGHNIATLDLISNPDKIIFLDHPNIDINELKNLKEKGIKLYLVAQESELIRPENYDAELNAVYDKIFTWNINYVDGEKYIKYYLPTRMVSDIDKGKPNKKALSMMMSSNKNINYPGELYTERINVIEYFLKNHPHDFHLFGYGWSMYPSWRGISKNKIETISWYKFAFCYENYLNNTEYITEKIFDVMISNTVPIYHGYKDIDKYIPKDCYISLTDFDSDYDKLYNYITNMSDEDYDKYLGNIRNYIKSDNAKIFSGEQYAELIYKEITKE